MLHRFLRENLLARMLRDAVHAGNDPEGIGSSSSSALERSADKSLLQLIQLACKSDKHSRALDAARALHSEPTLDAAIQIAGFFHLPALAERMQNTRPIVSRRKEQEEAEAARWCSRTAGPAPGLGGAYGGAGSSRILVPASQEYGYGSPAPRTAARAFTEEFAPRSTRRSFGTGNGVSGLEGAGGRETRAPSASTSVTPAPAPAPAPAPSSSLWPEPSHLNGVGAADADASVEIDDGVGGGEESLQTLASEEESQTSLVSAIALGGGGKRKSIETDDEDSQGSAVGAMPAPPRAAKVGGE